jgi:hypothetical protein
MRYLILINNILTLFKLCEKVTNDYDLLYLMDFDMFHVHDDNAITVNDGFHTVKLTSLEIDQTEKDFGSVALRIYNFPGDPPPVTPFESRLLNKPVPPGAWIECSKTNYTETTFTLGESFRIYIDGGTYIFEIPFSEISRPNQVNILQPAFYQTTAQYQEP